CETRAVNTTTGIATCKTSYATVGVRKITASFSGSVDTLYEASESPPVETTVETETSTRLEASTSSPSKNEFVTYTATVTPAPDDGTVAFKDTGTPIGGCTTQAVNTTTGIATCEVSFSTIGAHTISASFSGSTDSLYRPSTSSFADTTAQTETGTKLAASAGIAVTGQPVTYTATVTPVPDGGSVAFKDAGTPISDCATQAVSTTTGIATCEISYPTAGEHGITASFSGSPDTVYRPSTSPEYEITVQTAKAPPAGSGTGKPGSGTTAATKPAVIPTHAPRGLIDVRSLKVVFGCGSSPCSGIAALTVTLGGHHWTMQSPLGRAGADAHGTLTIPVPAALRRTLRKHLLHHPHSPPRAGLLVILTASGSAPEASKVNLGVWTLKGFR
ncbi:MAG TPA: Ig-like domain-containing protein, partial [Solirubrobacteraceae bacterium]|nr:Ig-like domain-containing protein [Solirubrobacteraceae bacterium]